ncbi:hypothetical protein PVAND_010012 [Polypedilum vanderplanki]|uniref:R-spondin Fu-CRD domain-containing protein n=1 Tax=Polypedilum vanderplanki TaxID=319348 RepID=A0A9J6CE98_POLVA|nr:hypothetical protein PVAND_010012 [Polypedilum vanderplanki]
MAKIININYENKTCVPCEANCASCQDRPDYCTSCEHHLVMHEHKCYAACPKNTYETEDFNCADCHASCASCNGSSESQCIQCKPNRFSLDGKCLLSCPDGHYGDKKRKECLPCPMGCATCSNDKCIKCKDEWVKNKKDKCVTKGSNDCDESEYYDNGHCHSCHSTCETCMGPTENDCLTCSNNLLLQNNKCVSTCDKGYFMEAGVCTMCLHTCTQCVSRMNCTECVKGLQLQSGECRATCADGYYSDRGSCVKCYLSCDTCSGPRRDQCVRCPNGWKLAAGECHPECPEGFFKTEFGCQKCHHYCKTCNAAGPLSCTSCPTHFMLEGGLCTECLSMQYYDSLTQTCKTCHESCRSCSGPGQYSCISCAFPLHLDRLNNQCVPCCATDATPEDQSCCHCDKDTGDCINSSPAGKRRIAAEKQLSQLTDEGNIFNSNDAALIDGGGLLVNDAAASTMDQIKSPVTFVGIIAVAVCSVIVVIFVTVFSVLQKRNHKKSFIGIKYDKLDTDHEQMKPLRMQESSSTKLLITANQEYHDNPSSLENVNNLEFELDEDEGDDDEETKFITKKSKNKSHHNYSYYTSSTERT